MVDNYKNKLKKEQEWYIKSKFKMNHFLNCRLFYSRKRNSFNYVFPKKQFFKFVTQIINFSKLKNPRILIAPVGNGDDIKYLKHFTNDISGIDISEEALKKIPIDIKKYFGDISNMHMFSNNSFDIIISPLFFHHFTKFGFDNFLKEIYRTLKPNGYFFSLEPSIFYPISWVTWFGKKIFGNITGSIEDERAFIPFKLSKSMKQCGFRDIKIYGASFSHNRIPICIAKINNILTYPLLKIPIIKYFAWMCIFYGKKNKN